MAATKAQSRKRFMGSHRHWLINAYIMQMRQLLSSAPTGVYHMFEVVALLAEQAWYLWWVPGSDHIAPQTFQHCLLRKTWPFEQLAQHKHNYTIRWLITLLSWLSLLLDDTLCLYVIECHIKLYVRTLRECWMMLWYRKYL